MKNNQLYYFFCNHWTEGGIGYAFPFGWFNGKKHKKAFSSVYTIEKMLDAADQYPSIIASMELDAYTYDVLSIQHPQTLDRLRRYIQNGRASVEGGTYGQPFGQDYGWEFNIRQLTLGRKTIREHLGCDVQAFLVEEQWFHPQMPQLLLQSGFRYASLQNQNSGQVKPMNKSMIHWVGIDGSKLPTIPANNIMVSCVRQYTDYREYQNLLFNEYEHPLLFQWVEVWVPGMDWGASAEPFEKAIAQAAQWGAKPVSLQQYFESVIPELTLEDIRIYQDEANYGNDWYQNGGWGCDGDLVMTENRICENSLLSLENITACRLASWETCPDAPLEMLWKEILVLQNHDSSCARGYRAFDENGMETNAGAYIVKKYRELNDRCADLLSGNIAFSDNEAKIDVYSYKSYVSLSEVELHRIQIPSGYKVLVRKTDGSLLKSATHDQNGEQVLCFADTLPAFGKNRYILTLQAKKQVDIPYAQTPLHLDDDDFSVYWQPGSWDIQICHKSSGQQLCFVPFSGSIGKMNEHDLLYPALSSAHKIFSFAFDGNAHCPDQRTQMRVQGRIKEKNSYQSTLELHCEILNLHTTDTPVAFCRTQVTINHVTMDLSLSSYLYTGVSLNVQLYSILRHENPSARYFRDFPFGEEETKIDATNANSYLRIQTDKAAFTLLNPGTQRLLIHRGEKNHEISHKLSKNKLFGEYSWNFKLRFNTQDGKDSIRLFKDNQYIYPAMATADETDSELYENSNPTIIASTHYVKDNRLYIRMVNYSEFPQSTTFRFPGHILDSAHLCDFEENVRDNIPHDEHTLSLHFAAWEIKTLSCILDHNQ